MLLTPHFSLRELTSTATGLDNTPTTEAIVNLVHLAMNLENVRRVCNDRPIIVSSGYRSPEVNTMVGGVRSSQHLKGQAVDFTFGSKALNSAYFEKIKGWCKFDQLILECGGAWIHLSFVAEHLGKNRQQAIKR